LICDCCGTEFGYQDGLLTAVLAQRERWLRADAPWFSPKEKPPDWDLDRQLAEIPPEWRGAAS
jgi:hypothetical protein